MDDSLWMDSTRLAVHKGYLKKIKIWPFDLLTVQMQSFSQSPFQGKSVHSAAIFEMPLGSSDKTKSYLNEWGNPEISKTSHWTRY